MSSPEASKLPEQNATERTEVKTFTISVKGDIAAFECASDARALDHRTKRFRSARELQYVTAKCSLEQLAAVWNQLRAGPPVKRFRDRKTGVMRIWKAVQNLKPSNPKAEDAARSKHASVIPQTSRPENTAEDRKITRVAQVIGLLEQPGGASLKAIIAATGWQAHSVRGLISGHLRKKLGLRVKSFRRDGERVYAIRARNQTAVDIAKTTKKGKRKR